jgi:hypothetical protein
MTSQFMVLLTEEKGAARGELKFLASATDVAHYIETLLEGGFDRESIRVFHGSEIELEISYRPVVSLSAAAEPPPPEEPEAPAPAAAESQNGDVPAEGDAAEGEEVQGVRNGVRFSELFRPS